MGIHYSEPLTCFPDKVVLISDKKWGTDVFLELSKAFNRNGIKTYVIDAKKYRSKTPYVKSVLSGDPKKTFIMYYDPGNIDGRDWCFTSKVNPSPDIPWGVYRGGSLYRVDNLEIREKKNLDIVRYMNKRFDDRATVVMCGTECLMGINKFSVFLGYPMDFPKYIEGKKPGSIGHVTTGVDGVTPDRVREIMKGSCTIKREFNKINFMRTSIVGKPHIPKPQMMKWLNNTGMVVNTYTSWDSGFGRGSLEGCAHSCLGMSKNSEFAEKINSPIVNLLEAIRLG